MTAPQKFSVSWEKLFVEEANERHHSEDYIRACLDYATRLKTRNLPIIFDQKHLGLILNIHEGLLDQRNFDGYYRSYYIRKKHRHGVRLISSPVHWLKQVQRWIYTNILLKDSSVSPNAFGFLPKGYAGRSDITIKTNAEVHVGQNWLINIDLKDYFPSIHRDRVYGYFESLGYTAEVVEALTKLCIRNGTLPQGAPTSPMLSNLICSPLDSRMEEIAGAYNAHYTRYADDLSFSGTDGRPPISLIYLEITACGFIPNYSKTKIRHSGQRRMVTGLTISDGVHVPKKYRDEVLRELYFCKKFGVESHIEMHRAVHNSQQGFYKEWLLGKIMFINSIEPETGKKMLDIFNNLSWL